MAARMSDEQKEKILTLSLREGKTPKEVSELTGFSVPTIKYQLKKYEEFLNKEPETEEAPDEEEKDADYWKGWAEFWEDKYKEEHIKLVRLQAVQTE